MNAVLKEPTTIDENAGLALIEKKPLVEVLVINDNMPDDFYKNTEKYQAQIDAAIKLAKSLAHEINDEGRKSAKADVALIRKYAKTTNGFSLDVFRSLTEKVKSWREIITGKTKLLEAEADSIMARFDKLEKEKLDSIKSLLESQLVSTRRELGIKAEFQVKDVDLSGMVKLSGTLTDKGKLTTKAVSFIKAIANGELAHQNKTEKRLLIISNKCLELDIKPPLTDVHLGADLYADDETFEATLSRLITAELERMDQLKANITKQVTEENKQVLAGALAEQQEVAIETVRKELPAYSSGFGFGRAIASVQKKEPEPQIAQPVPVGTRTVILTATFEFDGITDKTSNEAVEKFFREKLPEQMQAKVKSLSSENA